MKTNNENDSTFLAIKREHLNLNGFPESSAQPELSSEELVKPKVVLPCSGNELLRNLPGGNRFPDKFWKRSLIIKQV